LDVTLASIDRLIELGPARLCYGHFGCYNDAVNRLKLYRDKLVDWCDTVRLQAGLGKLPEEILLALRQKDSDLDYLDTLDKEAYEREHSLLLNTVNGMMGPLP
jgi:hypothetical protein